ncbi:MAG: SDR family oxidoreductase [Prochlorothrix sp.]
MTQRRVLVTGATGRTGSIALQKLRDRSDQFDGIGFARSSDKAQELFGSTTGFFFGDVRDRSSLDRALEGCQGLIILSSSVPQVKTPPQPGQRPEFFFPDGETPEMVDYEGQCHQIEAAKAAGVTHVVLVSSMGGTQPDHPLNRLGNGNVLVWKRKAEQYLLDSGLTYTIIHPGGLLDQPGGERELLVGKADTLLSETPNGIPPSLPRADVAEVAVQAFLCPEAQNKGFDLISKPVDDPTGQVTQDFAALFARTRDGL